MNGANSGDRIPPLPELVRKLPNWSWSGGPLGLETETLDPAETRRAETDAAERLLKAHASFGRRLESDSKLFEQRTLDVEALRISAAAKFPDGTEPGPMAAFLDLIGGILRDVYRKPPSDCALLAAPVRSGRTEWSALLYAPLKSSVTNAVARTPCAAAALDALIRFEPRFAGFKWSVRCDVCEAVRFGEEWLFPEALEAPCDGRQEVSAFVFDNLVRTSRGEELKDWFPNEGADGSRWGTPLPAQYARWLDESEKSRVVFNRSGR